MIKKTITLAIAGASLLPLTSCGTVGHNFDASALNGIVNGKTTQAEVEAALGKPFRTGVENGRPVWIYEYSVYRAIGEETSKDAILVFDQNGVVVSHQTMGSQGGSPRH